MSSYAGRTPPRSPQQKMRSAPRPRASHRARFESERFVVNAAEQCNPHRFMLSRRRLMFRPLSNGWTEVFPSAVNTGRNCHALARRKVYPPRQVATCPECLPFRGPLNNPRRKPPPYCSDHIITAELSPRDSCKSPPIASMSGTPRARWRMAGSSPAKKSPVRAARCIQQDRTDVNPTVRHDSVVIRLSERWQMQDEIVRFYQSFGFGARNFESRSCNRSRRSDEIVPITPSSLLVGMTARNLAGSPMRL